jgi:septal ring factor EnvC (AmiA/AmiB activator)
MRSGMMGWRAAPGHSRRALAALAAMLALGLAMAAAATAPGRARSEESRTRARLQAVRGEIERITRQVTRAQLEQDRLTRELRATESSVGKARSVLHGLDRQRAASDARLAALESEKRRRRADLDADRKALAGELRAAYLIGPEEPLKLLLDQGDAARAGRMFVYYSYFGRARARQIGKVEADLAQIGKLDDQLRAENGQLATLAQQQQDQVRSLEQARSRRLAVLSSIAASTRTRGERLARLKRQQSGLEGLLRRLRRAASRLPPPLASAPFAHLRGHLPWPVRGRVLKRFGAERAGGLRWDGDLIATRRDAPVRAVCAGRVIYADWLAGLGLLIIVDHGDGYLSLYGHNARLYRAVGAWVRAGETIAAAGDTGGSLRPELYFGLRRGARPLDPQHWLVPDPRE